MIGYMCRNSMCFFVCVVIFFQSQIKCNQIYVTCFLKHNLGFRHRLTHKPCQSISCYVLHESIRQGIRDTLWELNKLCYSQLFICYYFLQCLQSSRIICTQISFKTILVINPFITGQTNKPTNQLTDGPQGSQGSYTSDFRYYNSEKAFPD